MIEQADGVPPRAKWLLVLAVIFLLALAPRVAVTYQFDGPPTFGNDAGWYDFFGHQIAEGRGYATPGDAPTSAWPPGYPIFLGAVYKTTGGSRGAARLVQALLGAATAVLAAELGRRLISMRTGALAGAVTAFLPSHILYTSALMSEVLFTALLLAAFVIAVRPRSALMAALAGAVFGLATLVRAQAALLAVPVIVSWWAYGYARRGEWRRFVTMVAALIGGAIVVVAPWTVRNAVRLETFAPVSTNLGLNLWIGNNPDARGGFNTAGTAPFAQAVAALPRPESEVAYDRIARRAALRYIVRHPLTTAARAPRKIFATYRNDRSWAAWYEPTGTRYLDPRARDRLGALEDAYYYALLLAAALGFALLAAARHRAFLLPFGILAVWSFVSVIFFGDTRYHIPVLPVLAVPAAYALVRAAAAMSGGGSGATPDAPERTRIAPDAQGRR